MFRWIRRSDHPSRPNAMTCCFFSSFKTLLTLTEGIALASKSMSGTLLIVGRFSGDHVWPVLGVHRGDIAGATVYRGILGYGAKGHTHKSGRLPFSRDLPVDRKSTRLNSSHLGISYAVFCL